MVAAPGMVMMSDCQFTTFPRNVCVCLWITTEKDSNGILHIHSRQEDFFLMIFPLILPDLSTNLTFGVLG